MGQSNSSAAATRASATKRSAPTTSASTLHVDQKTASWDRSRFAAVGGLKSESAVVELEEGGFNGTTRKLIGRTKFPNIVLKQGMCSAQLGAVEAAAAVLERRSDARRWATRRGGRRPTASAASSRRWGRTAPRPSGSSPAAGSASGKGRTSTPSKNEISIESIEIAHEGPDACCRARKSQVADGRARLHAAFVPRTVASFERAATAVARRVAAPVRTLATRALSFADRLRRQLGGRGADGGRVRGRARAAADAGCRGAAAGMPVPRPWYEVEADEDVGCGRSRA